VHFRPEPGAIVRHKFLLGDERIPPFCALSRLRLHEISWRRRKKPEWRCAAGSPRVKFHDDNDGEQWIFPTSDRAFDLLAGSTASARPRGSSLVGTAFLPRPSGYGGVAPEVPRPDYVLGMEFLQGIGSKAGHAAGRRSHVSLPHPPQAGRWYSSA